MTQGEQGTQNVFAEWEPEVDDNFFEETKEVVDNPIDKKTVEEEAEAAKKIEDEIFSDLTDIAEEEIIEEEDTKKVKTEDSVSTKKGTLTYLKEKGLVEYELEEGQELTDELADEILEDSFYDAVDTRLKEITKTLPKSLVDMINYAKDGGDVEELMSSMYSQSPKSISKDMDLDDVDNQITIMKASLKSEGKDDSEIDTYVEYLKDNGKLKNTAATAFTKAIKKQEEFLAEKTKEQNAAKDNAIKAQRQYKQDLSTYLEDNKTVGSFKFSSKEKVEIPAYISERSVKLDNGNSVTPIQKDLYDALQDKEKTLMLAKILKSGFNFKDLATEAETKVATKVKDGLQHSDKIKNEQNRTKKGLADFF